LIVIKARRFFSIVSGALGFALSTPLHSGLAASTLPTAGSGDDLIRVCSITGINDPLAKIFKRHLIDSDKVVFQNIGPSQSAPQSWVRRACATGLSCDVLILNTELLMGGKTPGKSFNLQTLFGDAKKEQCAGVLGRPVEVIVVGNQTLDQDSKEFLKKSQLFTGITEVQGFQQARPEGEGITVALEDYAADTMFWMNKVRSRMKARDFQCQYKEEELPKTMALSGAVSVFAPQSPFTGIPNRSQASLTPASGEKPELCPKLAN
jgi:hypothetical protein